uniref:DH domain-containing protein n=1 Tax=Arcella intermedia TaxID=1963864 RepID=A0A6B2LE31_9EUKA
MNQIFKANSELLLSLQTKFKNWDENQTIGEVLCAMAPWLRVYNEYLVTFDDALAALQNKNKVLQQIMESGSTHPINSRHLPLQAFLIEPVQRLPRYPLLIKALIKLTPQNHPDYAFLDKADKEFSEIASIMDEAIESSRNATKIVELQNSFLDLTIVQPHRIYVCEIEVLWSIEKDSKKTQAKMYMFNDAILIADKKLFPTLPEEVSIGDIPDSDSFSVHLNIKNPPYTADLIAETTEDAKKKWMRKYSSVMDKLLLSPRGLKKL